MELRHVMLLQLLALNHNIHQLVVHVFCVLVLVKHAKELVLVKDFILILLHVHNVILMQFYVLQLKLLKVVIKDIM